MIREWVPCSLPLVTLSIIGTASALGEQKDSGVKMIEGTIKEVRESLPPQLVVDFDGVTFDVALTEGAVIEVDGREQGYPSLQRGSLFRFEGKPSNGQAFLANRVVGLEEAKGRIVRVTEKPGGVLILRDGKELSLLFAEEMLVLDAKKKTMKPSELSKDLTVRVRFFRQLDKNDKKVTLRASSIKVLDAAGP